MPTMPTLCCRQADEDNQSPEKAKCAKFCCRKADRQDPAGAKRQKQQPQSDAQTDMQFGKMDMGTAGQSGTQHKKKKKPSKEQLLQEAVQKQTADGAAEPQVVAQ